MASLTILAGASSPLVDAVEVVADLPRGARVVVLPTAAAFVGARESADALATELAPLGRVRVAWVVDRPGAEDVDLARQVDGADLVVLSDGSALHLRSVLRASLVGDAVRDAARLVALGAAGGALFEVMVDPRGGAPTTGLGYREGLVVTTPGPPAQLERTRHLLGPEARLAVLGETGVLVGEGERWRVAREPVTVTRGRDEISLAGT